MKGLARFGVAMAMTLAGMLVFTALPAQATFPGANGKLALIDRGDKVLTMNPDGSEPTHPGLQATTVAWSPDGTKLTYSDTTAFTPTISVANADGSDATPLVPGDETAWSPDGSEIAFVSLSGDGIYLMDPDGTDITLLVSLPGPHNLEWSPDGKQIAFTFDAADYSYDIWVIRPDGTELTNLTNTDRYSFYGAESQPSWSPDSKTILFRANNADGFNNFQLYTMNRDGGGRTHISTPLEAGSGVWSPDGRKIAFINNSCGNDRFDWVNCGIWLLNADGSGLVQVFQRWHLWGLDWQPVPQLTFKNASKKCKAQPGDYRNHGQCVKANK